MASLRVSLLQGALLGSQLERAFWFSVLWPLFGFGVTKLLLVREKPELFAKPGL